MGQVLFKLLPHLVQRPWGGKNILEWKKIKDCPIENVGESFEISVLKDNESIVESTQEKLSSLIERISKELNVPFSSPFLVKFIDADDNLSIQVHPDGKNALKLEGLNNGKTECWCILDAAPDAKIYLGFKSLLNQTNVLEKKNDIAEQFRQAVLNGENPTKFLNEFPVKRGDFFFVPAGIVHAIGEHISLLEIQEISGVTYRLWDWNRVDDHGLPRELHLDKGLLSTSFTMLQSTNEQIVELLSIKHNLLSDDSLCTGSDSYSLSFDGFFSIQIEKFFKRNDKTHAHRTIQIKEKGRVVGITVVTGEVEIVSKENGVEEKISLKSYQSAIYFAKKIDSQIELISDKDFVVVINY